MELLINSQKGNYNEHQTTAENTGYSIAPSTGTLTSGTLAWVVNAHTATNRVTVAGAVASSVVIPPNTGIIIEKDSGAVLDVATTGGEVCCNCNRLYKLIKLLSNDTDISTK